MSEPGHDDPLEAVVLTRRYRLWQRRRGHRTTTDDVLCAWAGVRAAPDARRVLDLGCGQGAVTVLVAGALPGAHVTAVEAEPASVALLRRNVEANALGGRVVTVAGDLRSVDLRGHGPFDLVTGTPPFMRLGSGSLPRDPQRTAARFELRGGIEAYLTTARAHLATSGLVSLLMDGAQDARCRRAVADAGLRLVRRILIAPTAGAPTRFIVYQAAAASTATTPSEDLAFAVRTSDGRWTPDFETIRRTLDLPNPAGVIER